MAFEMRLARLELTNYRQFDRYTIDFDDQVTVLVGENGSGKTSLLDAASVALEAFFAGFPGLPTRKILPSDARVKVFDMGDVYDRQEQYPVLVAAQGMVGDGDAAELVSWERGLFSADDKRDASRIFENAQNLVGLSHTCMKRVQEGDADLVLPVIAFYGAGRLWSGAQQPVREQDMTLTRLDGYKNALSASVDEKQMLSWFFKMAAQDVERAQSLHAKPESPLYAAVRGAVESCFTAITGCRNVRVAYSFVESELMVSYEDALGEPVQMPIGCLSDGYRATLSMFSDIAYRMALLNPMLGKDVLSTPGVVLIDEIDLHLHPLWQARILGDLRTVFPRVQFIVTTHAPTVVSSVSAKNIRLLHGGAEASVPGGEIYGSDADRVLVSIMGASERPEEVRRSFDEFYRALEEKDFERARGLVEDIEDRIGSEDTDLVGAKTALALDEAEARYAAD